jgi:hypothetical protein
MVYYGKGFSWTEVYHMPIWLRKFYLKKMQEAQEQRSQSVKEAQESSSTAKRRVRK